MRASLPTGIILDVLVCENVLHEPVSPTGVKEESPLRVASGPNTFLRRKSRAAKLHFGIVPRVVQNVRDLRGID